MTEDEAINRHIDRYFALLQAQLDASPDDWPERFTFPEPRDGAERLAFERFLVKMREARIPVEPVEFTQAEQKSLNNYSRIQ